MSMVTGMLLAELMNHKDITFVCSDDWTGMYINGKLVLENHSLHPYEVLKALRIEYEHVEANEQWLNDRGAAT